MVDNCSINAIWVEGASGDVEDPFANSEAIRQEFTEDFKQDLSRTGFRFVGRVLEGDLALSECSEARFNFHFTSLNRDFRSLSRGM